MSERLAVIGASSIQDYIFRSNRLREQVAASRKVEEALALWREWPNSFVGGGNAVVRFESRDRAERAVYEWSRRHLEASPGLRFSVGYSDWAGDGGDSYRQALQKRQECEEAPAGGGEPGALPICVTCPSTGLAATTARQDDQGRALSAEAASKRERMDHVHRDFGRYEQCLDGWEFPLDLDALGAIENASQVAVVHADGNGVGERVREALETGGLQELEGLSGRLTAIGRATWDELIGGLRRQAERWNWNQPKQLALKNSSHGFFMPIRPIVDGGDDATWVCAGKIGLATAARYLKIFERQAAAVHENLTACAGVAIVPKGYPFSRAYALAASLCRRAKRKSRQQSGLDYQVVLGGSTQIIDDMRSRSSVYEPYSARPYFLRPEWEALEQAVLHFQNNWPRSRSKAQLQAYGRRSPIDEKALHEHRKYKWPDGATEKQVFDALELLDFHLPWNDGGNDAAANES